MTAPVNVAFDPKIEGEVKFTLQWDNERSFFDRLFNRPKPVLALGCYYETDFGGKSLIDRLQFTHNHGDRHTMTRQGCLDMIPYIWHEGTDKADNGECSESIIANYQKLTKLTHIAAYAFVVAGKARWKRINPRLSVELPGSEPLIFEFAAKPKNKRMVYAIADIEINQQGLCIKPLYTLHRGHGDCNDTYNWGLNVAP